MLTGDAVAGTTVDDDLAYVMGLGLIRLHDGAWQPANPIYREIIPRALTHARQTQIDQRRQWYLRADGGLDMGKLVAGWQSFWREDGHLAAAGFDYKEAGPQSSSLPARSEEQSPRVLVAPASRSSWGRRSWFGTRAST